MDGIELVGPGWQTSDRVAVRGSAFDDGGRVDLRAAFEAADSFDGVLQVADRLDGFFAAVVDLDDAIALVCDHARSVPLYFTTTSPARASDVAARLETPDRFDPVAESEFLLTRYVTAGDTLAPSVASVRAGEAVAVPRDRPGQFRRRRYRRYRPTDAVEGDDEPLLEQARDVLGSALDRTARLIGDRPAVVPLSGGWDSRLVASMLVDRDVEVVAFTFGVPGHADVEVSRDVAEALGIRWEWVEYSTDRWHRWYHSAERREYHEFAFDYDSLPFLAEWPAVRELVRQGRIPDDAVVCPGHTVATPSERVPGEWVDPDRPVDQEDLVEYVLEEHYDLWDWDDPHAESTFAGRVLAEATPPDPETGGEAAAAYEGWEWATRMVTFTNNDARVYDWFGLDWWLPLWDPAYVRFWETVPLAHRHGKALHRKCAARTYADVAGIPVERARRTDRDWTPADQVVRTVRTDPQAPLADGFDDWLGAQAVPRSRWDEWGNYPLGWYGVVPEEAAGQFAAAKDLYALRTMEAVGRLAFDPPNVEDPPLERTIELPASAKRSTGDSR